MKRNKKNFFTGYYEYKEELEIKEYPIFEDL